MPENRFVVARQSNAAIPYGGPTEQSRERVGTMHRDNRSSGRGKTSVSVSQLSRKVEARQQQHRISGRRATLKNNPDDERCIYSSGPRATLKSNPSYCCTVCTLLVLVQPQKASLLLYVVFFFCQRVDINAYSAIGEYMSMSYRLG